MIVDDPSKGIVDGNIIHHSGDDKTCKHLEVDEFGESSCLIHQYPWYKETPCFSHGQIESSENDPCRVGEYILKSHSCDHDFQDFDGKGKTPIVGPCLICTKCGKVG